MTLTPKEIFVKYEPESAKLLALALSEPWFRVAASAALAQMAHGESAEPRSKFPEIPGANAFLRTLHALVEESKPVKQPDDSLPTYEQQSHRLPGEQF